MGSMAYRPWAYFPNMINIYKIYLIFFNNVPAHSTLPNMQSIIQLFLASIGAGFITTAMVLFSYHFYCCWKVHVQIISRFIRLWELLKWLLTLFWAILERLIQHHIPCKLVFCSNMTASFMMFYVNFSFSWMFNCFVIICFTMPSFSFSLLCSHIEKKSPKI